MAVASIASHVKADNFARSHIRLINDAVVWARACPDRGLTMHALHEKSLPIVEFADASFSNNADFSTQLAFIIFLWDRIPRANCMHYTSYKCKRIVRCVLGGELYTLAESHDYAFLLRHGIVAELGTSFPFIILTEWMSLFNVFIHSSTVSTKKVDDPHHHSPGAV